MSKDMSAGTTPSDLDLDRLWMWLAVAGYGDDGEPKGEPGK